MQIKTAVTGNENLFKETSRQRQQRQLHEVSGYIIFSLPSLASNCTRYHIFFIIFPIFHFFKENCSVEILE